MSVKIWNQLVIEVAGEQCVLSDGQSKVSCRKYFKTLGEKLALSQKNVTSERIVSHNVLYYKQAGLFIARYQVIFYAHNLFE